MQSSAGGLQLALAGSEIDRVVRVAPVGRAATREHQPTVAELAEVVRHETLRLVNELRQLPYRPIAADQLA